MKKNQHNVCYHIEPLSSDNWRPNDPSYGYLVYYRFHETFGWTGRKVCKTQAEAESYATEVKE